MKRYSWFLILAFVLSLPLFSHEGSLAGAGKLRVSQTKYFDIIYSEKNVVTAGILYENADAVFEELAATYGTVPNFRLPVVITTTVEQFNAYYSDSPYNRIVVYDTAQIEDLAVFSQTLLSTFTHELTHAMTYNYKNKTMRTLGKIFGDAFANHYITVTSGMAEGATVSYESSKGEGRLNDPYALQMIRQAKIEGKFPKYSDVKGSADVYPRNSFYYFNGAFADYLQKNFGMHKYAEFWYRCINIEHLSDLTVAGAFKKTFGIKLNRAWKMFEEALPVPEVAAAEPVEAGLAKDFFAPEKQKLSMKNKAGSLYTMLASSQSGLVFVDESCDTVYSYKDEKIKKLFGRDYIDSVKLSYDGRFLAVGYYTSASPTVKHCAAIYDMQYKKWIDVPGTNYVSPGIVSDGSNYYFIAQNYQPQKYSVCVKKLDVQDSKVKIADENIVLKEFGVEEVPTCFTDLGNGKFAYIFKSALDYSVCVSDITFSDIKQYEAPLERMKLRDLAVEGIAGAAGTDSLRLMFSWATKETLPRLGYLDLNEEQFSLSQENISGGIYTPVEYKGHVYYTGHFYKETRLLELVDCGSVVAQEPRDDVVVADNSAVVELVETTALPYKRFSSFSYMFEGLLIPVGGVFTGGNPTLGFTYLTSLPWYAGLTILSGGYDFKSKSGIFDLSYQSGTDTSLFQYTIQPSFAVDKDGFKYFTGYGSAVTSFDFARRSAIAFNFEANAKYGRILNDSMINLFTTMQLASVSYSNVSFTGPGTYEKSGIVFTSGVAHLYEEQTAPNPEKLTDLYDVEFDVSFYIPKLIPIVCQNDFVYNMPAKIKTYFFSLSSNKMRLARVNAETVLFGYDIQKAVPFVSALYANDIVLTLGYTGGFDYLSAQDAQRNWHLLYVTEYMDDIKNKSIDYKDYFTLKLSLGFTPNIGSFPSTSLIVPVKVAFKAPSSPVTATYLYTSTVFPLEFSFASTNSACPSLNFPSFSPNLIAMFGILFLSNFSDAVTSILYSVPSLLSPFTDITFISSFDIVGAILSTKIVYPNLSFSFASESDIVSPSIKSIFTLPCSVSAPTVIVAVVAVSPSDTTGVAVKTSPAFNSIGFA